MIDNPDYKGEWKPKQIPNPNYSGVWVHPEIDNPEYEADDKLYLYNDIGAIGFDLWQVKSGTIFDNVLVTDDEAHAEEVGKQLWEKTKDGEKKMKEEQDEEERKKNEEEAKARGEEDDEDMDEDLDMDEDMEDDMDEESPHDELRALFISAHH